MNCLPCTLSPRTQILFYKNPTNATVFLPSLGPITVEEYLTERLFDSHRAYSEMINNIISECVTKPMECSKRK